MSVKKPLKTKSKSKKKSSKKIKKPLIRGILVFFALIIIASSVVGYKYYKLIYKANIDLHGKETTYIYIPTNSNYQNVKDLLYKNDFIINKDAFEWLSVKKNYPNNIKSGRYLLKNGMTNNTLINMLRSGKQEPIKVTYNNIRTKKQLASRISLQIEADSNELLEMLNDEEVIKSYNLKGDEIMCIFMPNTYELYWNTHAKQFIDKMYKEYQKFWNADRKNKAAAIGLSPEKAVILASIIYQETKKNDEMPKVAGVYINRIKKGIPLQADPTVIFAIGDFGIKRLLNDQLSINSPYNTYINKGLPPGPICLPPPIVVEKVLDYEEHDYLYFCAKDDLSGYHNFAKTLEQHMQNARRYWAALNRRNIRK
jgi:UPF0755 protein